MVQCRIGSFVGVMPDFVCSAMRDGAVQLRVLGLRPDLDATDSGGLKACAIVAGHHLQASSKWDLYAACETVWVALLNDEDWWSRRALARRGPPHLEPW